MTEVLVEGNQSLHKEMVTGITKAGNVDKFLGEEFPKLLPGGGARRIMEHLAEYDEVPDTSNFSKEELEGYSEIYLNRTPRQFFDDVDKAIGQSHSGRDLEIYFELRKMGYSRRDLTQISD